MPLDGTLDLESAIRAVLPAVNVQPRSLEFDPGFDDRAMRKPPWLLALNGIRLLVIYVGDVADEDPNRGSDSAEQLALSSLSPTLLAECESLVVAWMAGGDGMYAAAYSMGSAESRSLRRLGTSWTAPASWPDPFIDASRPLGEVLDEALGDVSTVIRTRYGEADFDRDLDRATSVVDVVLRSAGGEGQDVSGLPTAAASRQEWTAWCDRFVMSVRDEWNRVTGRLASTRVGAATPTSGGALDGMRVFLSYARPDASTLARPVLEALRSQGADVWFDQDEPLDDGFLDRGLGATIAACTGYVLCASDEFFERAGYATQELAWAVLQHGSDSALRALVTVARPGALLPTVMQDWPHLVLPEGGAVAELSGQLAGALLSDARQRDVVRSAADAPSTAPSVVTPLVSDPDAGALLVRVRHRQRLHDVDIDTVTRLVASERRDAKGDRLARTLDAVGRGLDWDGTLRGIERWPTDPLTRAYRWQLACARTMANVRWPMSEASHDPAEVAAELQYLAAAPPPVRQWADADGWGDDERRLVLRYHASVLRVLESLIERRLVGGLGAAVSITTLDEWCRAFRLRRRDCLDQLISLRLEARLSWGRETANWDTLFGAWHPFLAHSDDPRNHVLPEVSLAMSALVNTISALAAQVTWHAARSAQLAAQTIHVTLAGRPIEVVCWAGPAADRPLVGDAGTRCIEIGLARRADGVTIVLVGWNGFDSSGSSDGVAELEPSTALRQVMNDASD